MTHLKGLALKNNLSVFNQAVRLALYQAPIERLFQPVDVFVKLLSENKKAYNPHRAHTTLGGQTPAELYSAPTVKLAYLNPFRPEKLCRGPIQLPHTA